MIYTFYSYKGGVGRSMALVNIAELFYQSGLKVLMIDWDLESPGLEHFFPHQTQAILETAGVIDLLQEYKEKWLTLDLNSKKNIFPAHNLKDFLIELHPNKNHPGQLWLLPAGKRDTNQFETYSRLVQNFDWADFYQNYAGEIYFEKLRELLATYDVVLIDSRTGVTEMGGVCTYQLADTVVMFCAGNNQNIQGTLRMAKNFADPDLTYLRHNRKLTTFLVAARIERFAETGPLNAFRRKFDTHFKKYTPPILNFEDGFPTALEIPYVPFYSFDETIAVNQAEKTERYSPDLTQAYKYLLHNLIQLIPDPQKKEYIQKDLKAKKLVLEDIKQTEYLFSNNKLEQKSQQRIAISFLLGLFGGLSLGSQLDALTNFTLPIGTISTIAFIVLTIFTLLYNFRN